MKRRTFDPPPPARAFLINALCSPLPLLPSGASPPAQKPRSSAYGAGESRCLLSMLYPDNHASPRASPICSLGVWPARLTCLTQKRFRFSLTPGLTGAARTTRPAGGGAWSFGKKPRYSLYSPSSTRLKSRASTKRLPRSSAHSIVATPPIPERKKLMGCQGSGR